MKVFRDFSQFEASDCVVVTIGAFDGVHLGHQRLIKQSIDRAAGIGCVSAVLSFDPLPKQVLRDDTITPYLTSIDEKIELVGKLDPSMFVILHFTRHLARMSPEHFMDMMRRHLPLRELWVGERFALGKGRSGGIVQLAEIGRKRGFELHVCRAVEVDGQVVSSTAIRQLVLEGRVDLAAKMLGRYHWITGKVVPGNKRGRELGFPTANLVSDPLRATPPAGVYAVFAEITDSEKADMLPGVMNIGTCPSFDGECQTLEVHLLDHDRDIYGRVLRVSFVRRLRDEIRFGSIDDLKRQIAADIEDARVILGAPGRPGQSLLSGGQVPAPGGDCSSK